MENSDGASSFELKIMMETIEGNETEVTVNTLKNLSLR